MQLEKYNKYKDALKIEASRVNFEMPLHGIWIKFYMPMPKSWSSKKRMRMNFEPKKSMPDLDNLLKAFKDSLFKQDNAVWDYRASKFWYDGEKGYIEVSDIL
jgi:Holliday junction resolvase RusA-like endonuclease